MTVTVYTLASTRNGEVRYVGQTVQSPTTRLRQHKCVAQGRRATAVQRWIAREIAEGFEIVIAAIATDAVLHDTEIALIAKYRADGYRLLNLTEGGEGTVGWRGNKGNKRPDLAERNRLGKGKPGRPNTPEARAKISAAKKGTKAPWLAERNRANTGKPGHRHSEESKAKIAAANTGHRVSEETRRKISEANKGRKLSPEQIANLRAGHKRYFASRGA